METNPNKNQENNTIKKAEPTIKKIEDIDVVDAEIVDDNKPETITISKAEYEKLKSDFVICKTTVETILAFIVPDNLRKLAEKTLREINSK